MGKGDKRTAKGKITRGTYGNVRAKAPKTGTKKTALTADPK